MRILSKIFEDHAHYGSDVGHADKGSTHSYIEEYEKLLAPYRYGCTIMEIGLALGWSLKMWCEYFCYCKIIGVDISIVFDPDEINPFGNLLYTIQADATKDDLISHKIVHKLDVVIDDGSHMEADQIKTFQLLKPKMKKGGIYIIEDILSIDTNRERFMSLHDNCEIIDLREKKNRFDDVLIVYRF